MTTAPATSSSYTFVESRRDAIDLAALLCHPERDHPVVVISSTKDGARINPSAVAKRLGEKASVYVLTASVAYAFEEAMPDETSVYGGAARTYPTGAAWHTNQRASMVRLAYSDAEAVDAVSLIARDVEDLEPYAPSIVTSSTPARTKDPEAVGCEVSWVMPPDGVMVKIPFGVARIDTSVLAPGIDPERLFTPGQKLTGTVRNGLLTITSGIHTVPEAVAHARQGIIHPALVVNEKRIALFPGLVVRHTSGLEPGSVTVVRIELSGRADGKAWKVTAVQDPQPEAITAALPFCVGGKPWVTWSPSEGHDPAAEEAGKGALVDDLEPLSLVVEVGPTAETLAEAEPAPEDEAASQPVPHTKARTDVTSALELIRTTLHELDEANQRLQAEARSLRLESANRKPSGPVPTPGASGAALDRAQQKIALLTREKIEMVEDLTRALGDADTLAAENASLAHENERLRESILTERGRAARARQLSREISAAGDTGPGFADPAEQFRHEVYLEWVARIPASSKASTPLPVFAFADGFLDSVESIQGVDRSKIVSVAVEVLTGIADSMPGREIHRLRTGPKGNTTFWEDPLFGTAWRVSLQAKVASARRLHFWRGTDGKVTFARVGVHDDMSI